MCYGQVQLLFFLVQNYSRLETCGFIQVKTSHGYIPDILLYEKKKNVISIQKSRISK